jgi:radical SAM protein with 4Fe4S-binding SPASM domain
MFYKKYCKHCSVRFICDGGCMLCDEDERINSFCLQNKAMFEAIIEGILAYK